MTIVIIKNTYPEHRGVAHAKQGDVVRWEADRGCYRLIRISDGKSLFSTPKVDKDGLLLSTKKPPVLTGVIAEIKSKGWVLEVGVKSWQ